MNDSTSHRPATERDAVARAALLALWGIEEVPTVVELGVNKETWRVGAHWLSADYPHAAERVRREQRLLTTLGTDPAAPFAVPRPVPSPTGQAPEHAGRIWRLTEHVPGRHPRPESVDDLRAVAHGLARLHAWTAGLDVELAVSEADSFALFEAGVALAASGDLPFAPADRELLAEAAEFSRAHPVGPAGRQLIHADPSYPNLRMPDQDAADLSGLLDWESCRLDVPLADLAVVGQTVMFRSGLPDPLGHLRLLLRGYQEAGGAEFDLDTLLTAMIMAKFESIDHHGRRFLRGEVDAGLALSQPAKIAAILGLRPGTGRRDGGTAAAP